MSAYQHLLDANVLIALSFPQHVHHEAARQWFTKHCSRFATCAITQGAFIQHSLREGYSSKQAVSNLGLITSLDGHEFWSHTIPYTEVALEGVIGHRQVTDAYLASLAARQGGRLATFDQGLDSLRGDVTTLIHID